MTEKTPALDLRAGTQRTFMQVLLSALLVSVINYTVWFAVTFWVYLETRSVFATGVIAGIFLVSIAATGIWFGSLVDHHRKKTVMQASAAVSLAVYAGCLAIYLLTPEATFQDPGERAAVGLRRAADARRGRRQPALDRDADPGDTAHPRGPARPGERPGRHDHGRVVPGHLRDQRSAGRRRRHVLRAAAGPRPCWRLALLHLAAVQVTGDAAGAAGARRGGRRRRPARHVPAGPGRAGSGRADRVLVLQQLPGRRVHGADGRLRPVAGVGAGLGSAVGRAQRVRDRRRPGGRPRRPGHQPGADPAAGQPGAVDGDRALPAAQLDRDAGRRHGRVHADDAVRGGGRADRAPEGRAVRAAGPGFRLRPERRAGGLAADGVPASARSPSSWSSRS